MRNTTLLLVITLTCCTATDDSASLARAPIVGKADSADKADRSCTIVLRTIGRLPASSGYQTQCAAGVCNWVWTGTVELAEGTQPANVRVLYHRLGDPSWWQVDASPASQSQPGFVQYTFAIHEHLVGPKASSSELAATRIELMPVLELADGTRLYDHNRRPGDLDNYVLEQANSFALGEDGACAPQVGHISFLGNWDEMLFGTLRQGAYLQIDYTLERLPTCRGTHNGYPAWDIVAHARFSPGGQLLTGSVRSFASPQGQPTNSAQPKPLALKIPADATAVEIWFLNYTGAGSSCQAWDSNYGANYRFDVWPPASDPRCKDIERWTSVNSDMPYSTPPYCMSYKVDQNENADACEVYLSGIGDGYMGHYGIPNNWLEAYLTVGPQQGTLLGAGVLTKYRDTGTKMAGQRVTFGQKVDATTWQTGFITHRTAIMGSGGFDYTVEQMAFFIDVKRPSGKVARLWQSRHGANYTWGDAFTAPTSSKPIPYGSIKYAGDGASVFDAKHACGK